MVATVGGALLAATIVEAAGAWGASVDSAAAKLTDLVTPALAWFVLLAGLTQLRRAPREAGLLVGAAAAGLGWLFGIADLSWLGASQLPTTLAPPLARTAIAVSLGCGAALVLHAAVSARDLLRHPTAASVRPPPVSGDTADRAVDVSAGLWRRYRWVLVGGVGAVVILSAAVLAGGSGDDPGTSPAPAPRDVHAELCAVLAIDDPAQAAARFAARVHDPLHRLIDDLVHDDRALAERLRSAKQRVEVAYADRSALPRQLEALEPVVREALAARGVRTQPCPDG